ncbi:hypothetical protein H2200_009173 [Cladophialophora chaetospira]|uniref:Uncharacterized protein n=1 Tax=Cladophialophora chaetospira TaxID=386627 RepID=A0AA38X3L2_9EURO|nr:hypothetical protein H2200_009173 [Cladophialophora chaetospira]
MADTGERPSAEPAAAHDLEVEDQLLFRPPRQITVYDAVAGRAGLNGFLSQTQRDAENVLPIPPEEVLLGRTTIPEGLIGKAYDDSGTLSLSERLPHSDVLKAVHSYASDFYSAVTAEQGKFDFKSLDETALVAMGILLEEAIQEAMGQNGDMVFVEPEGLKNGLDETKLTKHQIKGKVKPARAAMVDSDEDYLKDEESPAKKQRH